MHRLLKVFLIDRTGTVGQIRSLRFTLPDVMPNDVLTPLTGPGARG